MTECSGKDSREHCCVQHRDDTQHVTKYRALHCYNISWSAWILSPTQHPHLKPAHHITPHHKLYQTMLPLPVSPGCDPIIEAPKFSPKKSFYAWKLLHTQTHTHSLFPVSIGSPFLFQISHGDLSHWGGPGEEEGGENSPVALTEVFAHISTSKISDISLS